jgi:hypothetical protein
MKAKTKRRLLSYIALAAAIVLLVEFNQFMKRQDPRCIDGCCPRPDGYDLIIDPFPAEIVPQGATTNQINGDTENE